MKVLWLSHLIPYPPKGGVLQRAYYLLSEISKYHVVDLIAFNQEELLEPLYSNLAEGVLDARANLEKHCRKVEFIHIPLYRGRLGKVGMAIKSMFTQDCYTLNWLKSTKYSEVLQKYLSAEDYDLVHFDTISLVPYLHLIKKIPAVLDHHNIESHMLRRRSENENNLFKKWYYKQEGVRLEEVEIEYCTRFKLNITCSKVDGERLRELSSSTNIVEVPNGVDLEYFHKGTNGDKHKLIFVGTLNWYPNAQAVRFIVRQLWPELQREFENIYFDLVGSNPPIEAIRLSEEDVNFKVHGFVDDIRPLVNDAGIFICPITDGGGTKLKILDALAMGKAIVAHPIACEGIDVTDGVNVMFADNVSDYITKIRLLISDDQLRLSMGVAARELVEKKYSYTAIGKQLSELYQTCLN